MAEWGGGGWGDGRRGNTEGRKREKEGGTEVVKEGGKRERWR